MLIRVKDSSAGSSSCCKPWPASLPEASTNSASAKPKEPKLLGGGKHANSETPKLLATPPSAASSREFRGLLADLRIRQDVFFKQLLEPSGPLADMRSRQETFFQQVLEHNEKLRSELSELHSSSQASIEERYVILKQNQEDLLAEFREFSSHKRGNQRIVQDKLQEIPFKTPRLSTLTQEGSIRPAALKLQVAPPISTVIQECNIKPAEGPESHEHADGCFSCTVAQLESEIPQKPPLRSSSHLYDSWMLKSSVRSEPEELRGSSQARGSLLEFGLGITRQRSEHTTKLFNDMGMDKKALDQEDYKVENFYYETGKAQLIARSDSFANVTLFVIFMNAVYIGYDADNNHEESLFDADLQFIIFENAFCVFFFWEWIVRFLAFRRKLDGLKDIWFKFDTVLVLMMVVETWILPVFVSGGTGIPSGLVKLVRLLRLARMARMMRAFPDLIAMIKGVKAASRAVGSALLMLLALIYVFAIIMFTLLKDEKSIQVNIRFRRLGLSMWTLLIDGTFLDSTGALSRALMDSNHYLPLLVLLVFVLCSALTVMNMLIGVLCEVVSAVATAEREDSAIRIVKEKLLCLLKDLDEDGSGRISSEEMTELLGNDSALSVLDELHVDVPHFLSHLDMCFETTKELPIVKIMDLILMLREDRPPTIKDMLLETQLVQWKTTKSLEKVKHSIVDSYE